VAQPQLKEDLAKLVSEWCAIEQIAQLLRDAKDTSGEVRVSAPKKEILIEENLRKAVEARAIPLDKVYNLIRESEENGNQHIFYYRRSGQSGTLDDVATRLWGAQWQKKMDLPRTDLVENDFIFADLHPWNARLKPLDWVLKIYGHEYVAQRTSEFGIRIALGANRTDVLRLVLVQSIKLTLAGTVAGVIAGMALMRALRSVLYGVSAADPTSFAAAAILLMTVALLASYMPARRAMKTDPMVALRYE
jgi:hypothetical protein